MLATAREQSRAFNFLRSLRPFSIEDLIMDLRTKLAIIGLGVKVLMLLGVAMLMLWRS